MRQSGGNAPLPGWLLVTPVVLVCAALPAPRLALQLAACAPLVAVFGVPHGATDWKLAGLLWRGRFGKSWPLLFALFYGVLMAVAGLAAALTPQAAMLAFVAVAVWHFGTEDAAALGVRAGVPEIVACGALPVLVPALFWPGDYTLVLHSLGVLPADAAGVVRIVGAASVAVCAAAAALAVLRNPLFGYKLGADLLAIVALEAAAPPLVAFTAYFCLLHGPRHMRALMPSLRGWQTSVVAAAAVAIVGAAATVAARQVHADLDWALANGLFWGLAALTLPHVILGLIMAHRVQTNDPGPVSAVRA